MSWNPPPGQDPNQPNPSQYGGYTPQPNPTDPYSGGQQPGSGYQQPGSGYQQPGAGYGQQQAGYQQPGAGYQQPYGAPPPGMGASAGPLGPTSIGMEANVAAGLSYVFGWVGGLVIFLMEKQNRFVRFNAMQSILFFGALTVLDIGISIIGRFGDIVALVGCFGGWAIGLIAFIGWIVLMINAFQGKYFKLPIIGDYAERYANQGTGTRM
ncbi:MAG: DUF4870 domain-containing protein [Chloroflexota bacterium]|nr:DUF4870 domain-containing protein [Chloroflexota bacterium]